MSRVMCHMSRVTCQLSHVTCFFGQSGLAFWWRVYYQRGLPRLVFFNPSLIAYAQFNLVKISLLLFSAVQFGLAYFSVGRVISGKLYMV